MNQKVNSATVKELHSLFGMTLKQLSEGIGIPSSTLGGWFNKDRYYVEYLVALCNFLLLPLDALLIAEDEEEYIDKQIRQKVIPANKFVPITYLRSRIRQHIKSQSHDGYGVNEIADAALIGRTSLFKIKNDAVKGKNRVTSWTDFRYLASLSRVLHVPVSDFFQGSFSADKVNHPAPIPTKKELRKAASAYSTNSEMEKRIAALEHELAMQRALVSQINETMHRLVQLMDASHHMANEEPPAYKPATVVSKEPDTATSAVKSM
ncbi:MAG: hypothetical protein ACI36Z_03125 [Alloprevotella sp.]